ncbi:MAG: YciI family protein [Rhizobiaceae bacterium]|nr:YciI family protein [Rhizobiaceae bacterium]
MQYAILCYDDESILETWSDARMDEVIGKHQAATRPVAARGKLGPVLRLLPTSTAMTVRSGDKPTVIDGPFAETKEQLLGLWIIDAETHEEALALAEELAGHKDSGSMEVRPLLMFMDGKAPAA